VPFVGYELHVGSTTGAGTSRPFLRFDDACAGGAGSASGGVSMDGAVSTDGRIAGCYVHGLFGATAARAALLSAIGAAPGEQDHAARVDAALDDIAGELERCLDIDALAAIAGL
jgi:adenosylcobyric acid synthase